MHNAVSRPRLWGLLVETGAWLGLACTAWLLTFAGGPRPSMFRWGEQVWPRAVILLIAGTAILRCVLEWRRLRQAMPAATVASDAPSRAGDAEAVARSRLVVPAILGIPLVYAYLLPRTGFLVATPFFIAAMTILLGERRPGHVLAITVAIQSAVIIVFQMVFFVPLPVGRWPFFYDLTTRFMTVLGSPLF